MVMRQGTNHVACGGDPMTKSYSCFTLYSEFVHTEIHKRCEIKSLGKGSWPSHFRISEREINERAFQKVDRKWEPIHLEVTVNFCGMWSWCIA